VALRVARRRSVPALNPKPDLRVRPRPPGVVPVCCSVDILPSVLLRFVTVDMLVSYISAAYMVGIARALVMSLTSDYSRSRTPLTHCHSEEIVYQFRVTLRDSLGNSDVMVVNQVLCVIPVSTIGGDEAGVKAGVQFVLVLTVRVAHAVAGRGLPDVSCHVIETKFEPSFLSLKARHPMTWR